MTVAVLNSYSSKQRFVFTHQYGVHALVFANHLDHAMEEYGEYLLAYHPGLIVPLYGDEHKRMLAEAAEKKGLRFESMDDDKKMALCEEVESDYTYTESGLIVSHEWCLALENPDRGSLKAFIEEHGGALPPPEPYPGWHVDNNGCVCLMQTSLRTVCNVRVLPTSPRVKTAVNCLGCIGAT